jgi:hypothetical protein
VIFGQSARKEAKMAARDDLKQALKRLDRAKQEHGAAATRLSRHLAGVEVGAARLLSATVEFSAALGEVDIALRKVIADGGLS